MAGDTSIDMMINVLPGTLTGIFALNAGLSSINQQFQNMTKAVDNHFGIVDAAIVSATALATQFGLKAADAFGQYEQGMKIVQAVSNQSAASIAELGQKASEFSVQYRMDIDELTTGLQTLGRAGLKSAQEQTEVLENGLQTAKLEGRDLNSVLEELIQNTALLGGDLKSANFGEQTKYVNDLSVATSMTAPITTHDVSETLKYSGGIAAAAGANIETEEGKRLLEDYMASIAAFAQKGVKGSIAGTALRAFFNKPATQDSSVLEGLSMIGLKPEYLWEDDQETMKPVSEQINLIQKQMDKKGISQMDRLQIWSKIVGGKMGQQMMKLDGGQIKELTNDIREANSAENLATQSMQTYQSAMKQTGEAGQQAFRAFGEHLARFLTPVAKMLTPILQAMANPYISTAAFTGFIALIRNAWKSVSKIFSALRLEIGTIKSLMSSTILNQETRKGIVGNRPWGSRGFTDERVAVEQISAKVKETNAVSNSGSTEVVAKLEEIRRIVTAVNNTIKEVLIDIKAQLSTGISTYSQELNQAIVTTGGKIKTEFGSSLTQAADSFGTTMSQVVSTTATKMKTEFTIALRALSFTPNFSKNMFAGVIGTNAMFRDVNSPFSGTYSYLSRELKTLENEYKTKMTAFSEKNNPMILRNTMYSSISGEEKAIKKLEGQKQKYLDEANKLKKDRDAQNKGLKYGQKGYVYPTQKETFKRTQASLLEEEISIRKEFVTKLKAKMALLEKELIAAKFTGRPAAPVVGGATTSYMPGHVNMLSVPSEYQPNYSTSSPTYGRWNLPPAYAPHYSVMGGEQNAWKFGTGTGKGQSLLANLRSQEIAMTKEMQQALGISNKELIKFYEELLQVNAVLARTSVTQGGKTTVYPGGSGEQAYQEKLARDSLYKTKGNMVPIYGLSGSESLSGRDRRAMRALFGENNGPSAKEFEKEFKESRQKVRDNLNRSIRNINEISRYNLPGGIYSENQMNALLNKNNANIGQSVGGGLAASSVTRSMIDETVKMQEEQMKKIQKKSLLTRAKQTDFGKNFTKAFSSKGLSNISKGLQGMGSSLASVTNLMGGPFFAAIMGIDIAMQIWNSKQQEYNKKLEEATQKMDDMIQKQSEAEEIFYGGKHEKGEREIQGWDDENPNADYETRQQALLDAYGSIYDNAEKGLSELDENTQQLAIATEELKRATEVAGKVYTDGSFFSGTGVYQHMMDLYEGTPNKEPDRLAEFLTSAISGGAWLSSIGLKTSGVFGSTKYDDKSGKTISSGKESYFENTEALLTSQQKSENYPWLKEFGPLLASDIWKTGSTKGGLKVVLGDDGYARLNDQLSSTGGWDNSAWTRHGYNIANYFGSNEEQNKLQMGLKNYQKDFSNLAKQMRKYEKATGVTPLRALNREKSQTKNMKKALNNLSVQDPKLVSYIKSLAIKTGMSEQQVLMAAQLQQLQDMQDIANNQVNPKLMSLVSTAYQQVAYGGQTLSTVSGSGEGAISAAQNAAAIAALLQVKVESELGQQAFAEYTDNLKGEKGKYETPEQLMAAAKNAHNLSVRGELPANQKYLLNYYDNYMESYARVNAQVLSPGRTQEQIDKFASDFMKGSTGATSSAMLDTLRKGLNYGVTREILAAYDADLDNQDSGGSGGSGSGKGSDKDKDTGTKKERVDLVLCNKKEIPKLNVNLFKKAPSFTILNKNFKLRDIKVNTQDKPKAVLASIKNAIIDVQKRTDPKIIQDEEAIYDPVGATDGNTPSGTSDVKTNSS